MKLRHQLYSMVVLLVFIPLCYLAPNGSGTFLVDALVLLLTLAIALGCEKGELLHGLYVRLMQWLEPVQQAEAQPRLYAPEDPWHAPELPAFRRHIGL